MKLKNLTNDSAALLVFSLVWAFGLAPFIIIVPSLLIPAFNRANATWQIDTLWAFNFIPALLAAAWAFRLEVTARPAGRKEWLAHIVLLIFITLVLLGFLLLIAANVWFALHPYDRISD